MTTGPHKTTPAATAVALTGADQQIATGNAVFMGYAVADDAAGVPVVNFYNGTDNTGTLITTARKLDGKHETEWFGPNGVHCPDGIYADVTAGTPSGSVFIVQ